MSSDTAGMAAQIGLANQDLATANGQPIPDHALSLRRTPLVLDDGPVLDNGPVFTDTAGTGSFGASRITLPLNCLSHAGTTAAASPMLPLCLHLKYCDRALHPGVRKGASSARRAGGVAMGGVVVGLHWGSGTDKVGGCARQPTL